MRRQINLKLGIAIGVVVLVAVGFLSMKLFAGDVERESAPVAVKQSNDPNISTEAISREGQKFNQAAN